MFNVLTISSAAMDFVSRGTFAVLAVGVTEPQALALFGASLYAFALAARRVIKRREERAAVLPVRLRHHPEPAV